MGGHSSKRRLSKEDLEYLKARTSYDDSTIKKWHKGFRIDCPSGHLTPRFVLLINCVRSALENIFKEYRVLTFAELPYMKNIKIRLQF